MLSALLDLVLERRCPACSSQQWRGCGCCELGPAIDASHLPAMRSVADVIALGAYSGTARPLILAAKNGGRRDLLRHFGTMLAAEVMRVFPPVDLVTWVPASREGRRRRGFDQAQVLASAVARELGRPCRSVLVSTTGVAQRGAGAAARRRRPPLRTCRRVAGRVLVIDDVVTTGATLAAAAEALHAAGSDEVVGAVIAASLVPAVDAPSAYIGRPSRSRR